LDLRNLSLSRNDLKKIALKEIVRNNGTNNPINENEFDNLTGELTSAKLSDLKKNKTERKEFFENHGFTLRIKFASSNLDAFTIPVKEAIRKVYENRNIPETKKKEFLDILSLLDSRDNSRPINNYTAIAI
jgi:hypothetical protein